MPNPRVVILGSGFAGQGAAMKLKDAPVDVTLIDKNDYHTFQPLLYQLATDELGPSEVGYPIRDLIHEQKNLVFHQAPITGVDFAGKQVHVHGMDPIAYDYLVIGLGAVVNFFGTKGAQEHAFPLYTLVDAVRLKKHILELLEAADKNPALIDDGALYFSVVGGGPTGVETAGALAELLHAVAEEDYPNLPIRERAEIHLYEAGPHLLAPFQPRLREYTVNSLQKLGVHVHLGEGVVEITPESIALKSGKTVRTRTLVWGAGIQANPLAGSFGVEQVRGGRIPVALDLSLKDHPEVFVVGDVALITDAKTNQPLPQLGSVAQQAGRHAGENIARIVKGEATKPFEYHDKGTMATIGRGAAVVQLPGDHTMTGRAAWLAWMAVHAALLSGTEQKATTVVDWGWNVATKKRGKRMIVSDEDVESEGT